MSRDELEAPSLENLESLEPVRPVETHEESAKAHRQLLRERLDTDSYDFELLQVRRTPLSLESTFLMHVVGDLKSRSSDVDVPTVTAPELSMMNVGRPRFVSAGTLLLDENTADYRRIMVLKGQVGVEVFQNEEWVRVLNGRKGSVLGGLDRDWLSIDQMTKGLYRLVVDSDYVPNLQHARNTVVGLEKNWAQLPFSNLSKFIDDLSMDDRAMAHTLNITFNRLKEKYPDQFHYHQLIEHLMKQEGLDDGMEWSTFEQLLDTAFRTLVLSRSQYEKGAHIAFVDQSQFLQQQFNEQVLCPTLLSEVNRLENGYPSQSVTDSCHQARTFFDENYRTNEGRVIPLNFLPQELISHSVESPTIQNNPEENCDISDDMKSALQALHISQAYATSNTLPVLLKMEDCSSLMAELEKRRLVFCVEGQVFLTGEGMRHVQSSPDRESEINFLLLSHFAQGENYFFLCHFLIEMDTDFELVNQLPPQQIKAFVKSLTQVPHPYLSQEMQLKTLNVLSSVFPENDPHLEEIDFTLIMSHYLSNSSRSLERTVELVEGYMSRYIQAIDQPIYEDRYINLIFIYFEALEALEKWDDILAFVYQHEDEDLLSIVLKEEEVQLWLQYSSEKAKLVQLDSDDEVLLRIDELEATFPSEDQLAQMHPFTRIKLRLTMQRLQRLAYRKGDAHRKEQAAEKVITYGQDAIDQDGAVNPIFLQAIMSNISIASRASGNYKQAFEYARMVAIDRRGEARELIDGGFILQSIFKTLLAHLKIGDITQIKASIANLIEVFSYLAYDRKLMAEMDVSSVTHFIQKMTPFLTEEERVVESVSCLLPEIEIMVRGVYFRMNHIGLKKANQVDTPYEKMLLAGNCFDNLFSIKDILQKNYEDGLLPPYLKHFAKEANLKEIGHYCLRCDEIFNEYYRDSYLNTPPVDEIFRDYMLLHRTELLSWLRGADMLEGKDVDDLMYLLQKGLLQHEEVIRRDVDRLFPDGLPEEFDEGAFGEMEEFLDEYRKKASHQWARLLNER